MNKPADLKCVKCGGSMVEGYSIDKGHSNTVVEGRWVEGPFQTTMWGNADMSGRDCRRISLWRCVKCGYLEGYAIEPAETPGFFTP